MWQKYMRKRGSLNAGRRIEAGSAMVAYMVNRMGGGKIEISDLMPHEIKPLTSDEKIMRAFFNGE